MTQSSSSGTPTAYLVSSGPDVNLGTTGLLRDVVDASRATLG